MKLAEALITRADYQKRIEQLKRRISMNLKIQEGEEPSEDPNAMLAELDGIMKELTFLIKRINKTNCSIQFDETRTLADALAERDQIWDKRLMLGKIAEEASVRNDRYSRTEIKIISTVDVKAIQKQVDQLSKEFREMDTKIQGLNWSIDLI
ncbi:DIP1984 family protein [Sporosarcina thermotolerans]|uniref:DIP1984 family protein n=1 Tax=Sporosarcina thermotolerans TaxID=633404 RepID=A0AAW9AET9_9BACL|nr:DIP1984 family protein [Sporosarcina thermotolerans]MDW0117663.1 DIP1984 family protein [Sporosarcina thermotolerans]WHT49245.1 DIP1984 family protein [Sporosarcina thermotolerans]